MPVNQERSTPLTGLSPETQNLWLVSQRYRRLADELAPRWAHAQRGPA